MLVRDNRLSKDRDIRSVLRRGRGFRGEALRISFLRTRRAPPRFAVVVSAKVSKKATVRNRLKRQVRGLLSARLRAFPQGIDCLLSVLPGRRPTRELFARDIERLLSHLT